MKKMADIKMRINNNKESKCFNCGKQWDYTREMFDLRIGYKKERTLPLCLKCVETMEKKFLKATCMYNAKLKTKVDMKRAQREKVLENEENGFGFRKINEALKGMGIKDDSE